VGVASGGGVLGAGWGLFALGGGAGGLSGCLGRRGGRVVPWDVGGVVLVRLGAGGRGGWAGWGRGVNCGGSRGGGGVCRFWGQGGRVGWGHEGGGVCSLAGREGVVCGRGGAKAHRRWDRHFAGLTGGRG